MDFLKCFKFHAVKWEHPWLIKQFVVHIGLLLRRAILDGMWTDDPAALDHYYVGKKVVDWNVLAGLQEKVAAMKKGHRRSAEYRRASAALRARMAFLGVEHKDAMKYFLAGCKHFSEVRSFSCSVDNTRMGCMDTMFGVLCGRARGSGEELAMVLPPQELRGLLISRAGKPASRQLGLFGFVGGGGAARLPGVCK